ncbi:hypothetical protein CL617_03180 [archaeon]|nr:hypothetical protein [archaeon]|tara:strand:- start:4773 stop:5090 length:318 start_codon:yes stop_codon:yes gene_type:complete
MDYLESMKEFQEIYETNVEPNYKRGYIDFAYIAMNKITNSMLYIEVPNEFSEVYGFCMASAMTLENELMNGSKDSVEIAMMAFEIYFAMDYKSEKELLEKHLEMV